MRSWGRMRLSVFLLLVGGMGAVIGLIGRSYYLHRQDQIDTAELTKIGERALELGGKFPAGRIMSRPLIERNWWMGLPGERIRSASHMVEFEGVRGMGLSGRDDRAAKKFQTLLAHPEISALSITNCDFNPVIFEGSGEFPNIKNLLIGTDAPISGEFVFRKFPNLASLYLSGPVETKGWMWRELRSRNKVNSIYLRSPLSQESWDAIVDLPLRNLGIWYTLIPEVGQRYELRHELIRSSPPRVHFHGRMADTLHELTIGDRIVEPEALIQLTEYKRLRGLSLKVSASLDPVVEALLRKNMPETSIRLERIQPAYEHNY